MSEVSIQDKIKGMFLGVAIGDALFMPVEGFTAEKIREKYGRITNYVRPDGHKWFDGRQAGTWTDDTQLTLLVADSLIERKSFDVDDLARRHVECWQREGDLGFGSSTREAVKKLSSGVHWSESGRSDNPRHGLGNGLPMKIAPIGALKFSQFLQKQGQRTADFAFSPVLKVALRDFTLMTHYRRLALESSFAHVRAVEYCLTSLSRFFNFGFFVEIVVDAIKATPECKEQYFSARGLSIRIAALSRLSLYKLVDATIINMFDAGSGYVYNSLPFSYAFFLRKPYSIEALLDVGNAGGDTDTNASIVGGLLGALNGASIFPSYLVDGLWQRDRIIETADKFYKTFFLDTELQPSS